MYYAQSLIGKTVTMRTVSGEEVIAELLGVDPDISLLTVKNPRVIAVSNDEVVLMPFAITAETLSVPVDGNNLISVMETAKKTAEEYLQMVSEETVSQTEE